MALASGSLYQICSRGVAGDEQDPGIRTGGSNDLCQLDSVHSRHEDVGDDDVWTKVAHLLDRLAGIVYSRSFIAFVGEDLGKSVRNQVLVIDNEHGRLSFDRRIVGFAAGYTSALCVLRDATELSVGNREDCAHRVSSRRSFSFFVQPLGLSVGRKTLGSWLYIA